MTDNTTNQGGSDTGSALIAFDSADEHAGLPEELTEIDDYADELTEIDDDDSGGDGVPRTGAVRGGFGFAGLALAIVSLTTNWTSGVVVSHGQYSEEMNAPSSGLTVQQELNMYANAWHTQGWWALVFAAAAVLFGAGALLLPGIKRSGATPGWAKAAATSDWAGSRPRITDVPAGTSTFPVGNAIRRTTGEIRLRPGSGCRHCMQTTSAGSPAGAPQLGHVGLPSAGRMYC